MALAVLGALVVVGALVQARLRDRDAAVVARDGDPTSEAPIRTETATAPSGAAPPTPAATASASPLTVTAGAEASSAGGMSRTYTNPILDQEFPDPAVVRVSHGLYYAFGTQRVTPEGAVNIQVASSPDLVRWTVLPDALPDGAPWAGETRTYWAPHMRESNGTYFLYYSAQPDGTEDVQCLGVATSRSPAGPYMDKGEPFYCGPSGADIDPMILDDPRSGKAYVYWGSGGVITMDELAPDGLGFSAETQPTQVLLAGDYPYEGTEEPVVEGPWVVYRKPYYYLFYSGDSCCDYPAHYAVMVARSRNPEGPFEKLAEATDAPHSAILEASRRWNGPGHNSIVTDVEGRDWIAYHAIDTRNPRGPGGEGVRRVLLLDRLVYSDGWPRVARGRPSRREMPGPMAR